MKNRLLIGLVLLILISAGCTNSRWIINEEPKTDYNDRQLVDSRPVLLLESEPSLRDPVLILTTAELNEVEYAIRLVSERYVQKYRPRYLTLGLGLGTAAIAFYLASSDEPFSQEFTTNEQRALYMLGGAATLSSFLSMRPVGEPRPTGESQLLDKVGYTSGSDTSFVAVNNQINGRLIHQNAVLSESDGFFIRDGFAEINLFEAFEDVSIQSQTPEPFQVEFEYENRQFSFEFPVESIFQPFIVINRDNAALRSKPSNSSGQTLANLEIDSFIPLQEITEDGWFSLRYNLMDAYVSSDDAFIEWRLGQAENIAAMQAEDVAYGDVDIEVGLREVPVQDNRVGVIFALGNYRGSVVDIPNADRSARLARDYMITTLGISQDRIITISDMKLSDWEDFSQRIDSLNLGSVRMEDPESELFVYLVGHSQANDQNRLQLVPTDYQEHGNTIFLSEFFNAFGRFNASKRIFILETDFARGSLLGQVAQLSTLRGAALRETAQSFIQDHPQTAIFYGVNNGQQAGIFASPDGRVNNVYGFFTYYFFQALKNGQIEAGDIFRHVQRNVTFTSRRYYDRPQDPQFFGPATLRVGVEVNGD